MPRALKETSQFKTEKKRIKKSGRYDWEKMRSVVKELEQATIYQHRVTARQRQAA